MTLVLSLLALLLVLGMMLVGRFQWARLRTADLAALLAMVQAFDPSACSNLLDPGQTEFLRARLPARTFARLQRLRARAGLAYAMLAVHNASVWFRIGLLLSRSDLPQVASNGATIMREAVVLRVQAMFAASRLLVMLLAPRAGQTLDVLAKRHRELLALVPDAPHPALSRP